MTKAMHFKAKSRGGADRHGFDPLGRTYTLYSHVNRIPFYDVGNQQRNLNSFETIGSSFVEASCEKHFAGRAMPAQRRSTAVIC